MESNLRRWLCPLMRRNICSNWRKRMGYRVRSFMYSTPTVLRPRIVSKLCPSRSTASIIGNRFQRLGADAVMMNCRLYPGSQAAFLCTLLDLLAETNLSKARCGWLRRHWIHELNTSNHQSSVIFRAAAVGREHRNAV